VKAPREELAGGGSILVPHLPPVKAAPNGAFKKNKTKK
jgi:hypothetical protein